MKRKTKFISMVMAAALLLSAATGCAKKETQDESRTSSAPAASTPTASANNDVKESDTVSSDTPDDTDTAADTTDKEENNTSGDPLFAYYDLLDEEAKNTVAYYLLADSGAYSAVYKIKNDVCYKLTDNIAVLYNKNGEGETPVVIYDTDKMEIIGEFDLSQVISSVNSAASAAGYPARIEFCYFKIGPDDAYIWSSFQSGYSYDLDSRLSTYDCIHEMYFDFNGNLVKEIDTDYLSDYPILEVDAEHGTKKEITYYAHDGARLNASDRYVDVAEYNNKMYVFNSVYGYYCYDWNTGEWEALDTKSYTINWTHGRYLVLSSDSSTILYDMETDTVIATVDNSFTYPGYGNSGLVFENGELYRLRYPSDGSPAVKETILTTDVDADANVTPMNEQYYILIDSYGIFLREYGKGEDGEKTIILYE